MDWLKSGCELSAYEALHRFGCLRLAARIEELRKLGYNIETLRQKARQGVSYAVYRMADDTTKS